MFRTEPVTLRDCRQHGPGRGAELFVVEGDSACKTVCRARDCRNQAVIPMQGKPLNAIRAGKRAVGQFELFRVLIEAIGAGWDDQLELDKMRYERVILLFDPDADGIHCGALMSMFFHRWMRPILESGRLSVIRPPLFEIRSLETSETIHAYSDSHYQRLREELERQAIGYQSQRYRGLASMSDAALVETCLDPGTRNIHQLTCDDAEAAIRIFASATRNGGRQ